MFYHDHTHRTRPRLLYVPHVAMIGVGFTMFGYAGVPGVIFDRFGIGLTAFGLVMTATLLPFVIVQALSGYLTRRYTTTYLLQWTVIAHLLLTIPLELVGSYQLFLLARFLWGGAAGLLLTVGATHVARLVGDESASQEQGIYGGMITLGGALGFLVGPVLAPYAGSAGLHLGGAIIAGPALVLLAHADDTLTRAGERAEQAGVGPTWTVLTHPVVLWAAVFYFAVLGSYLTVSTFITTYFDELGVRGPLNAVVLLLTSVGRAAGGISAATLAVGDTGLIGTGLVVTTVGFGALGLISAGGAVVVIPLVAMFAVAVPFGGIFNLTAQVTAREGSALAVVVAVGNTAALVLPPVIGQLREITGSYRSGFVLLSGLNLIALAGVWWIRRQPNRL